MLHYFAGKGWFRFILLFTLNFFCKCDLFLESHIVRKKAGELYKNVDNIVLVRWSAVSCIEKGKISGGKIACTTLSIVSRWLFLSAPIFLFEHSRDAHIPHKARLNTRNFTSSGRNRTMIRKLPASRVEIGWTFFRPSGWSCSWRPCAFDYPRQKCTRSLGSHFVFVWSTTSMSS